MRITDLVLRHRLLVVLAWLAVAVAGAATAATTVGRLSFDFDLPGQAAYETNQKIVDTFGGGGLNDPLLLVVSGDDAVARARSVADTARTAVPRTRTVAPGDAGADALAVTPDRAVVVLYPPTAPGADPYVSAVPRLDKVAKDATTTSGTVTLSGFSVLEEGGLAATAASCSRSCWVGSVLSSCSPSCSGRSWPDCPCWSRPCPSSEPSWRCWG